MVHVNEDITIDLVLNKKLAAIFEGCAVLQGLRLFDVSVSLCEEVAIAEGGWN